MNWRDVPIPERVARRPRDHRGYPVPYVATSEREATNPRFRKPGGKWLLGELHQGRLNKAMMDPRCTVCGEKMPYAWQELSYMAMSSKTLISRTEVPNHAECLRYALQVCPALVSGRRSGSERGHELVVHRVRKLYPVFDGDGWSVVIVKSDVMSADAFVTEDDPPIIDAVEMDESKLPSL